LLTRYACLTRAKAGTINIQDCFAFGSQ